MSEKFPNRGKSFTTSMYRKSLKNTTYHYSMYSILKVSMIERFNRSLKNAMENVYAQRQLQVDELLRLMSDYNARKHCTIGMRLTT